MVTVIYEKQTCSLFGETIVVRKLKALPYGRLPKEYTKENPSFWCDIHFLSKRTVFERPVLNGRSKYLLIEGETYTKEEFTKRIKYIADAGERLYLLNALSKKMDKIMEEFINIFFFTSSPTNEALMGIDFAQGVEEPEWVKGMMKVPIQYAEEAPQQVNVRKWHGAKTIKF